MTRTPAEIKKDVLEYVDQAKFNAEEKQLDEKKSKVFEFVVGSKKEVSLPVVAFVTKTVPNRLVIQGELMIAKKEVEKLEKSEKTNAVLINMINNLVLSNVHYQILRNDKEAFEGILIKKNIEEIDLNKSKFVENWLRVQEVKGNASNRLSIELSQAIGASEQQVKTTDASDMSSIYK